MYIDVFCNSRFRRISHLVVIRHSESLANGDSIGNEVCHDGITFTVPQLNARRCSRHYRQHMEVKGYFIWMDEKRAILIINFFDCI